MYRRAFLVGVGALSGCAGVHNPFGGDSGSTGGSSGGGDGDGGSSAPDETRTSTGAATPTAEAEPTPTATPSAAELERMPVTDLFATARAQFTAAVEAYVGDGNSLVDVSARSDSFEPGPVIDHLHHARRAYEAADRSGLSAEHEATIQELRRFDATMRLLIDAQVLLTEAHTDLEEIVTAIDRVDPETVISLRKRVASRQERATTSVGELSSRRYETAVTALDAVSTAEFTTKRTQLVVETTALGDIDAALPNVADGVELFARARGKRTSGSPYTAAQLSRDAASVLGEGVTDLRSASTGITPPGRGLLPVATDLVTATRDARDAARALTNSIELDGE
jgi:hypothetical protein